MSEHTKEPWPQPVGDEWGGWEKGSSLSLGILDLADYRRAQLCVNACKGISNADLAMDNARFIEVFRERDELLAALKRLAKEHVIALEGGYDRIKSLGGDCDPVDVMERNSLALRDTRALIARAEANKL